MVGETIKLIGLLNKIGSTIAYKEHWSNEFSLKEIHESFAKYVKTIYWPRIEKECTKHELYELGFGNWDDKLVLMPLYLWDCVPDGTELTCINGSKYIKGEDKIDLDTRFGCIAYGFER
jgi:hypothetical protein